jgi:alkaline phosphatase
MHVLRCARGFLLIVVMVGGGAARALDPLAIAAETPVFVGAGDIGDCSPSSFATGALVARILAQRPSARAFTLGDNAYNVGSSEDFMRCYHPAWGGFRSRTVPVAGNHDWMTEGANGFTTYFGLTEPQPTWQSFDVGTWHVVVLDTDCAEVGGCGATSPQGLWLADDLALSRASCTLALWHHPRFSSGAHGSDTRSAELWRMLEAAGAELVLSGHDHHYERFAPLRHDGQRTPRGLVSIVAGTGGGRFYPVSPQREPGSIKAQASVAGVVVLALERKQARVWFVDVQDRIVDSAVVPCR